MQCFEEVETLLWCGDELYCVDAGPRGLTTIPRFSWAKGGRTLHWRPDDRLSLSFK